VSAREAFRGGPLLDRIEARVAPLPAGLRSAAFGALLVLGLTFYTLAARIILPLLFAVLLLAEPRTAGAMALILALAVIGGALAGFAFWVAKGWIRPIPLVGPYLGGMIAFLPYAAALGLVIRVIEGEPLFGPPGGAVVFAVAAITVIFGAQLGHELLRD
jgi:hypothetical protein